MPTKPYKELKNNPVTVAEPAVEYLTKAMLNSSSGLWNPNVPFVGTQEDWWEHIHRIEEGKFMPVSEVHQRISKWLDTQKM